MTDGGGRRRDGDGGADGDGRTARRQAAAPGWGVSSVLTSATSSRLQRGPCLRGSPVRALRPSAPVRASVPQPCCASPAARALPAVPRPVAATFNKDKRDSSVSGLVPIWTDAPSQSVCGPDWAVCGPDRAVCGPNTDCLQAVTELDAQSVGNMPGAGGYGDQCSTWGGRQGARRRGARRRGARREDARRGWTKAAGEE